MGRNWVVQSVSADAHSLAQDLKIHPTLAGILISRGLEAPDQIQKFLNPSFGHLEDPFVFQDMQKAVQRIHAAIAKKEKILIYGDYDVDGVTGSAILYPVLKKLGAQVEVHIPHRMNEGYGLNLKSLETLLKQKFKLVITVDNGIASPEPIQFIVDQGAEVIIVDHHNPKEKLPPAHAIVSSVMGGVGDPNLAACGLAFKLAWALLGSLEDACAHLDLVVLGTVADLAPVLGDNRILLKMGLPFLASTKRPGLRALMDVSKIDKRFISFRDIAFGLGPRINASGRMGSPLTAFKLLTTELPLEGKNLAQLLEEGNRQRQRVESDAFEEAVEQIELDPTAKDQKILVVESEGWHEGVLGIIAARLVERYRKPAVVISVKNGMGKGSGRSISAISIYEAILPHEKLLVSFGGHAQACGLTVEASNISLFRRKLNEAFVDQSQGGRGAELLIDGELDPEHLGKDFLGTLEKLSPFGPGHPKPLFVSRKLQVRGEVKKRGKDTLQCWMMDAAGKRTFEVVGFRSYSRWTAQTEKKEPVDIVYQPALKTFNGISSIQLELEDWR